MKPEQLYRKIQHPNSIEWMPVPIRGERTICTQHGGGIIGHRGYCPQSFLGGKCEPSKMWLVEVGGSDES